MRSLIALSGCLVVALLSSPDHALAQFDGFKTRGDYGLQSASQPPPGWYLVAPMYLRYHTGTFKDANGNVGLGMWGFELFGGTTVFFDDNKRWSLATMAFYETHTEKKGTDIRVGDVLTLEGGLGWSFLEGAASVGAAYYAQWKVTDDELGFDLDQLLDDLGLDVLAGIPIGRNRVYGIGPEFSFPIATKKKLIALLNARYFWEFGARTQLEGSTFVFTVTFPIPSVSLQ